MIHSPYYFVPLENQVFYPEWGQRSEEGFPPLHDVPFSDGLSGELEIEIEAKRPIYVRNHAEKPSGHLERFHPSAQQELTSEDRATFERWTSFCQMGGKYVIPGASVKGVIRNVLKISSFGSFRDAVPFSTADDERHSVRDLYLPPYQKKFVHGGEWNRAAKITTPIEFLSEGGWLCKEGERWIIYPSSYQRVDQSDLAALYPNLTWNDFLNTAPEDKAQDPRHSAVRAKYELWLRHSPSLEIHYEKGARVNQTLNGRHRTTGRMGGPLPLVYERATALSSGPDIGQLVFTGQPSNRRPPKNKHMEFIFELPGTCRARPGKIDLEPRQVREFESAHVESRAWRYWKPRFEAGEPVPVFWLRPEPGKPTKNGLQAFGLAQMFRYPADKTLRDGIPPEHLRDRQDLADLIFGTLTGDPLRGRAWFGQFRAQGRPVPMQTVWTVLGSPRPTYYPNYLEQEYDPDTGRLKDGKSYRTLMQKGNSPNDPDGKIQLRGWKRYATRPDVPADTPGRILPQRYDFSASDAIPPSFEAATAFSPLAPGTRFKGKLRFHNLRPAELGALLWVIEWGGKEELRHQIGMGKGMGLGSVKMSILNRSKTSFQRTDGKGAFTIEELRNEFVGAMGKAIPGWKDTDALGELLLLADSNACPGEQAVQYPTLTVNPNRNEFADAKRGDRKNGLNPLVLRTYGEVTRKRSRVEPWCPKGAATAGESAGAEDSVQDGELSEEIVTIFRKRGKRRAKGEDGMVGPIKNENEFTNLRPNTRWFATRAGTAASPEFTLRKLC